MSWFIMSIIVLVIGIILSIPIAAVLGNLGIVIGNYFTPYPLYRAIGEVFWNSGNNFTLFCIPLFVLIGELIVKSGVAEKMYESVNNFFVNVPGGLMHSNVLVSAMFAATSGSSVATAATIGTVAIPQARKYKYNEGLFSASIAAGGTLGILIPPSINLVVYGVLTNTSIPKLFLAGIIPGIILAGLFMLYILFASITKPELAGFKGNTKISWSTKLKALINLLPLLILFLVIIGSIYAGFATPTEAAALGLITTLIIIICQKKFNIKVLIDSFKGTIITTSMIMFIIMAASFLNSAFIAMNLQRLILDTIDHLNITPFQTLLVIIFMYFIIGFFIETLSMMVLTIPIVSPIISSLGYDLIWFGIVLIILVNMALITPPVGMNLYVVQGIRKRGSIGEMCYWIAPFVIMMFVVIGLLIKFPDLALFLTTR